MRRARLDPPGGDRDAGATMYALIDELFPVFRSMTGSGVRETLSVLQRHVPLAIREVPSGTRVFDWQVPQEWHFREAHITDARGRKILDAADSNLHIVNGSVGVKRTMPWRELRQHLHTLPDHPDWIPYRTAYFADRWGFCLSHSQYVELAAREDEEYHVCIDASLRDGSLTYGEVYLPGSSEDEVLFSTHVCHPSLANDNLSGIAVATELASRIALMDRRYSYRFIFIPATIGALAWLSTNEHHLGHIQHGLVLSLLGDPGPCTYKKSRRGTAEIDRAVEHVLRHSGKPFDVREFSPIGYDERQFCAPGFDLPIGCFMRTPNGEYPEYHTSADNLEFIGPEHLADSLHKCLAIVEVLEHNRAYLNQKPKGEPRLGPLGLYAAYGSDRQQAVMQEATMWVLNLSDGNHTLLEIADRSGLPFGTVMLAARALCEHHLLREYDLRGSLKPETCNPGARRRDLGREVDGVVTAERG